MEESNKENQIVTNQITADQIVANQIKLCDRVLLLNGGGSAAKTEGKQRKEPAEDRDAREAPRPAAEQEPPMGEAPAPRHRPLSIATDRRRAG